MQESAAPLLRLEVLGGAAPSGHAQAAQSQLLAELSGPVLAALGGAKPGPVRSLACPCGCVDATTKLLVHDSGGSPRLVVLVSPPQWPETVAQVFDATARAKNALGDGLGAAVLLPSSAGRACGRSWIILPYCRPLSTLPLWRRWCNRSLRRRALPWLRDLTAKTRAELPEEEIDAAIAAPLKHLASLREVGERLRQESERALERLQRKAWRPRTVLMHGDLTRGNFLTKADAPSGFVLIDWAGSRLRGFPFFDLVTFGRTAGLDSKGLTEEIARHRELLGCTPEEARFSFLAALGSLGMNLGQFPFERYLVLVKDRADYLESGLAPA